VSQPAIPPPPPPPPPPAPARACEECGATLDERQEICVECGHAAAPPERRRLRGALPTASLVAGVVLLAASGAYGLSAGGSSNVRDIGIGPKPPAADSLAEATPTPPPATTTPPPDTVPQATPTPPPASSSSSPAKKSKAAHKAKTPATTTPSTPSSGSNTSGGTQPSSGGNGGSTNKHPHRQHHTPTKTPPPSWLADGDPPFEAKNYNGGSRPAKAIDDNTKTAWMTRSSSVGIVVDTGAAQPYSEVGIVTSTPGFSVSVYSNTDDKRSGDLSADGWKLENRSSVAKYQTIRIKPKQQRYLLIYVTKLPSAKAAINEIKLIF
jgi:hypothetical protein